MNLIKSSIAATGLLALALPALAQTIPDVSRDVPTAQASPFNYVLSETKMKDTAAEAEASDDSGSKILGGREAAEGAWPWQVALVITNRPLDPNSQFCGGSMILDTWVLTAAHCVEYYDDSVGDWVDIPPDLIGILVGTNTIGPGNGDLVGVERIYSHPDYDPITIDNDIALIKLQRKPQANFQNVLVPTEADGDYLDQPGVPTVVTGWGLVEGGQNPTRLREVDIEMLPRDACNDALLNDRAEAAVDGFIWALDSLGFVNNDDRLAAWETFVSAAPTPLSPNMVCSGSYQGVKGSCKGDSGGPLVVPLTDGSWIQAGVVSWGVPGENSNMCSETNPFAIYTRLSNYFSWMDSTIRNH